MSEQFGNFLASLSEFLIFFVAATVLAILFVVIYTRVTRHNELALIKNVVAVRVESVEDPAHPIRELRTSHPAVPVAIELQHPGNRVAAGARDAVLGEFFGRVDEGAGER